jgi:hypothetical protein
LMSRAYPSSPLEARFHWHIQVWKPDLVERGCFIYLDPNLSTHKSSCSDSILSGSGAATAAAAASLPVPLIHARECWASDVYRHYIRTLPDILSRAMAV